MKTKMDPAYQTMAREHEISAVNSAKIATGALVSPRNVIINDHPTTN
jgi:hypothetical protein